MINISTSRSGVCLVPLPPSSVRGRGSAGGREKEAATRRTVAPQKDAGFRFRAAPSGEVNRNDKLEGVGRLDGIREGASLKHADRFVLNKRQIGEEGREGGIAAAARGRNGATGGARRGRDDSSGIVNLTFPQPLPTLPCGRRRRGLPRQPTPIPSLPPLSMPAYNFIGHTSRA